MRVSTCDIAIVGAGPYGLATAAHLCAVGVEARVFGEPMTFWQRHMPVGMYLRSSWEASHIADPQRAWTLDTYQHAHGTQVPAPVPRDSFIHYGLWFQGQAVPDVDRRTV